MDSTKRNRIIMFVGSLIVAVMFVSSYLSFGNNGSPTSSTTTASVSGVTVFGNANAMVEGYQSSVAITVKQKNSSDALNSTLSSLESNGLVISYNQVGLSAFSVYLAPNYTAYDLQQRISNALPANAVQLTGTEAVKIPSDLKMYYYSTLVPVYTPITNFTIQSSTLLPIGANIPVNIQAFISASNDTVYDSQIQVSPTGGA